MASAEPTHRLGIEPRRFLNWCKGCFDEGWEGEYPVIGYAPSGAPQFGSMRMKVIKEKIVDGHKVKVLPPGYAQRAYPAKNVTVRS